MKANVATETRKEMEVLEIAQVKAGIANTEERTKAIRLETARRNIEVLSNVLTKDITKNENDIVETMKKNIAVLKEI